MCDEIEIVLVCFIHTCTPTENRSNQYWSSNTNL